MKSYILKYQLFLKIAEKPLQIQDIITQCHHMLYSSTRGEFVAELSVSRKTLQGIDSL